jgi:hypothetical protein
MNWTEIGASHKLVLNIQRREQLAALNNQYQVI